MSSSFCAPKLSDVLKILSEQADVVDNYENACAVSRSKDHRSKQTFTDAVNYCMVLLRKTDRLTNHRSEVLSDEATLMGHEMFERIINIDVQMDVESEDDSYSNIIQQQIKSEPEEFIDLNIHAYSLATETEETTPVTLPCSSPSPDQSMETVETSSKVMTNVSPPKNQMVLEIPQETIQDFYRQLRSLSPKNLPKNFDDKQLPPSPVSLSGSDHTGDIAERKKSGSKRGGHLVLPLETKVKVVTLARAHPSWGLKMLQKKGSPLLRNMDQLRQWEKHVDNGGTWRDKWMKINTWTYERFLEARAKSQRVSTKMIHQWAVQAAREFYGARFKIEASPHWCRNFQRAYGLHGDNVHGYFNRDEPIGRTIEELRLLEKESKERENKEKSKQTCGEKSKSVFK